MDKAILNRLAAGEITVEQAEEEQRKLKQKPLGMKVSEKGCISVYGMGRFPCSLYPSQWLRLRDEKIGDADALDAIFAKAEEMVAADEAAKDEAAA